MTGDGAVTIALREKDERIAELEWAIAQWHAEEDDWVRDRAALEDEVVQEYKDKQAVTRFWHEALNELAAMKKWQSIARAVNPTVGEYCDGRMSKEARP